MNAMKVKASRNDRLSFHFLKCIIPRGYYAWQTFTHTIQSVYRWISIRIHDSLAILTSRHNLPTHTHNIPYCSRRTRLQAIFESAIGCVNRRIRITATICADGGIVALDHTRSITRQYTTISCHTERIQPYFGVLIGNHLVQLLANIQYTDSVIRPTRH
jgi:hypothetical protein